MDEIKRDTFNLMWGFVTEILHEQDGFHLWLYHKDIGFKMYILGCGTIDVVLNYATDERMLPHVVDYYKRFMTE